MSQQAERARSVVLIAATDPAKCNLCATVAELRPYGPSGENICYACGQKDKDGTKSRMSAHMERGAVTVDAFIQHLTNPEESQ